MNAVAPSAFARGIRVVRTAAAFAPLRSAAAGFVAFEDWPTVDVYAAHLHGVPPPRALDGEPLRFEAVREVASRSRRRSPRAVGGLYDGRIVEAGVVPTRPSNWHDFFNFLVWASFPNAKLALHRRQYGVQKERLPEVFRTLPGARTREQDALAMLDEGGLLLLADEKTRTSVEEACDGGDLARLIELSRRPGLHVFVFGHAVYEHLIHEGTPPVRASAVILAPSESGSPSLPSSFFERRTLADLWLKERIEDRSCFREPSPAPAVPLVPELFAGAEGE